MLYLLLGEDDFSVHEALEEIKKGIGDQTVLAANTTVLEGQRVTVEQLRSACETVPFLAESRLIIVEGLLGRFEYGNKSGTKRAVRQTGRQDEHQPIVDCVSRIPDFAVLVMVDGKISNHNPLLRGLSGVAEVKYFPLLKDAQLRQWIGRRVKAAGGSISLEAVDLLGRFVGSNLWLMAGEVNKLVLFAGGRRIKEEDVMNLVSYAQEVSVFAMVDAILESRAGVAQELLQQLLKQGAVPAYLLVMLSRQVQMMVLVKELKSRRKSGREIQERLGLASEFALRRVMDRADKYSPARLRVVYHRLLETDLSIKTGRYEGELALNILIAELCQRRAVSSLTN